MKSYLLDVTGGLVSFLPATYSEGTPSNQFQHNTKKYNKHFERSLGPSTCKECMTRETRSQQQTSLRSKERLHIGTINILN